MHSTSIHRLFSSLRAGVLAALMAMSIVSIAAVASDQQAVSAVKSGVGVAPGARPAARRPGGSQRQPDKRGSGIDVDSAKVNQEPSEGNRCSCDRRDVCVTARGSEFCTTDKGRRRMLPKR